MTERLLGTWKLVSAVREEIPSGARTDLFGPDPQGFLNYSPDGRMIALITRSGRKAAANGRPTPAEAEALFRSMLRNSASASAGVGLPLAAALRPLRVISAIMRPSGL